MITLSSQLLFCLENGRNGVGMEQHRRHRRMVESSEVAAINAGPFEIKEPNYTFFEALSRYARI